LVHCTFSDRPIATNSIDFPAEGLRP
jgi:hypothetical protein